MEEFKIKIIIAICTCILLFGLIGTAIYREATAEHEDRTISMTVDSVKYIPGYVTSDTYTDGNGNVHNRSEYHEAEYYVYLEYEGQRYRLNNAEEYYFCKEKIGRKVNVRVIWVKFKNGDVTIRPQAVVRE